MKFLTAFFILVFCGSSAFSATLNHQPKVSIDVNNSQYSGGIGINDNVLYKEVCSVGGVITIEIYLENLDRTFVVSNKVDIVTVHFDYPKEHGVLMGSLQALMLGGGSEGLHTSRFEEGYDEHVRFWFADPERDLLGQEWDGYIAHVNFFTTVNYQDHSFYLSIRKVELKSSKNDFKYVLMTDDEVHVRVRSDLCRPQIQKFTILQRLDTNHDGIINIADFLVFVKYYGQTVGWY